MGKVISKVYRARIPKPSVTRLRWKVCRRCRDFYRGTKYSKFCKKCAKPSGSFSKFNKKRKWKWYSTGKN